MEGQSVTAGEWLAPTVALQRFTPPAGYGLPAASPRHERIARYGFRIGSLRLVIGAGVGSEVVEDAGVTPIPNTPPWLAGVMSLRGHPVPVFDLAMALGQARTPRRPMVLVLGKGDRAAGLRIDELPVAVDAGQQVGLPTGLPPRLARHVTGACGTDGDTWLEFDESALFADLGGVA